MALEVEKIERVFVHNGEEIKDPGADLSIGEVKALLGATWPEVTNSKVSGPTLKDGKQVFTFSSQIGSKG